jgi:hypothetical protein
VRLNAADNLDHRNEQIQPEGYQQAATARVMDLRVVVPASQVSFAMIGMVRLVPMSA